VIEIEDLRVTRDGRAVLAVERWRLESGEAALLTGPSGSGKTTLLHTIAGLLAPDTGTVCIDGVDLAGLGEPARDVFRAGRMGIVFQTLRLVRTLTVAENLALALRLARRPVDRDRIRATLQRLGLRARAQQKPQTLSVGEAQRAALARAVIAAPRLLLADEPTSALDDANAAAAMDLLFSEARACDATLIVASHDARIRPRFTRTLDLATAP
jgi:putative ABC transport system ATP-binding protein